MSSATVDALVIEDLALEVVDLEASREKAVQAALTYRWLYLQTLSYLQMLEADRQSVWRRLQLSEQRLRQTMGVERWHSEEVDADP